METRLQERWAGIAAQSGFELLAVEVRPDPLHLFASAPPKFSPPQSRRYFQGLPARRLLPEFQSLRRADGGEKATVGAEGAAGDNVGTAEPVSSATIRPDLDESQTG